MGTKIKINFKKYISISILLVGTSLFFTNSKLEIIAILIAYLSTMANQVMLVYGVSELLNPAYVIAPNKRPNGKIITVFITKMIILALGFVFCEHIMGKKVILAVSNYLVLIFIMFYSIEKKVVE